MLFRFIGTYTGARNSITVFGVTFEGHEPAEVTDLDGIRRLSAHPEFERVEETEATEEDAAPKKRGRPRAA
ncbi:MAG: hypothetical protein ACRCYS_19665 [Beijerinckiaceae bacterium]